MEPISWIERISYDIGSNNENDCFRVTPFINWLYINITVITTVQSNQEVLERMKKKRSVLGTIENRRRNTIWHLIRQVHNKYHGKKDRKGKRVRDAS